MLHDGEHLWLVRLLLQRGLAAIYLVAFLSALNQAPALLGPRGWSPIRAFVKRVRFEEAPSVFHVQSTDAALRLVALLGIALSLVALSGVSERAPNGVSMAVWLALWALYLSFVNVGQRFYGFGWESMLVEAGFLAAFLGPTWIAPSWIPVLALRWMLFRTEFGAGLIKIRHDSCWRDLTCLYYHYETQPLPNPVSRFFHALPKPMHKASVVFSHFVQLACPFGLFFPQPVASIAGAFMIAHQLLLIVSGNYSWLNWLTVVLGVSAFSDDVIGAVFHVARFAPALAPRGLVFDAVLHAFGGVVIALSIRPALNLFAKEQLMNYSYNALHLINTYGAFGSVTRIRHEVIVEGTRADAPTDSSEWRAYEFRGKPGDVHRRPRQVAPYHLRLDWLMWFLPLSAHVDDEGVRALGYDDWFLGFVAKLLEGDRATLRLLAANPFDDEPPRFVRARFFRYRFTTRDERRATGAHWHREWVGDYLPPVSLAMLRSARGGPALDEADDRDVVAAPKKRARWLRRGRTRASLEESNE